MNIEKAIESLSNSANRGVTTFNDDFRDAERLGIEALKRERERRELDIDTRFGLLPGETKD